MKQVFAEWAPDFVSRDPCEYASVVVAGRLGIPTAQIAISVPVLADQFENGRRAAASHHCRDQQVLGNLPYRRATDGIAAEMAATPTVDKVLTRLLAE